MKHYRKIQNLFKFDEKSRTITGRNEPYETLKNIQWVGTEKIDGTSIVIHYDGERIEIGGHTDHSQLPPHLQKYLEDLFLTKEMEYVFEQMFEDKEVHIYGEGYGYKIQTNGDKYLPDNKVGFIIFEVNVDGYTLSLNNIFDVADKLGLPHVPVAFTGTLDEAIEFVKKHPVSTLNGGTHEMEGLVLQPVVDLYDRNGNILKCKCKYKDVKNLN